MKFEISGPLPKSHQMNESRLANSLEHGTERDTKHYQYPRVGSFTLLSYSRLCTLAINRAQSRCNLVLYTNSSLARGPKRKKIQWLFLLNRSKRSGLWGFEDESWDNGIQA